MTIPNAEDAEGSVDETEPCPVCGGKWRRAMSEIPWTLDTTIEGLEYIADSPDPEYGGFHPEAVKIAKNALRHLRAASCLHEACELWQIAESLECEGKTRRASQIREQASDVRDRALAKEEGNK